MNKVNKEKFLESLEKNLLYTSKAEKEEILEDYREHFRMGEANGKSEEETSKALGNPVFLARQYEARTAFEQAEKEQSVNNILKAVFSSIKFGVFNMFVVLIPVFILLIILIAFFAAAISITAFSVFTAFYSIYAYIRYGSEFFINPVAVFFFSIGGMALGLIITICDMQLARIAYKLIIKYLKCNLKQVTGRELEI